MARWLAVLVVVVGCAGELRGAGGDEPPADAGTELLDGGVADAGELDAGPVDPGPVGPDPDQQWPTPPDGMVAVPGGVYPLGCPEAEGCKAPVLPEYRVRLRPFFIDKTEVTRSEWKRCSDAGACGRSPEAVLEYLPHGSTSTSQGRTYCAWRGARLPTHDEWEAAARGFDGRRYPWGNEAADCTRAQLEGCPTGFPDNPAPVGLLPAGASPWGALDMLGNLEEVVEPASPRQTDTRGWSYLNSPNPLWGRRVVQGAYSGSTDYGFRCAKDAP